ncbi:uncharacterized protein A1O9_04794 [Exophiala aquamarina CBS 119918]|uniref:Uncharacterized protein n=1 Tax=Exophiala aquamarina CBS 119918 TaxID=1182545 RepID=A0A072PJ78_9EURO|nr:uncharacterized protein A1O9_04794 [Exophiala aquamarina CBS 119918]KEF59946.1 hypothetical protein A1O9_04794 [Exophiala aquamarina CBS 119918]
MNTVTRALGSSSPLSRALLSDLGKGALRHYLRSTDVQIAFDTEIVPLWHKLVSTARSPQVIDNHVTVASNTLCVFLNEGILSEAPKFKDFVLSKESWWDAFQCTHKAFDDGKTKPAFQLLETLCNLLQHMTDDVAEELLIRSALPLLTTVVLSTPRCDSKKACLILSLFIRRTPLRDLLPSLTERIMEENNSRWTYRLLSHNISDDDISSLGHGSMASFFCALIFTMVDLDTRASALKLYSNLCSYQSDNPASSDWQGTGGHAIKLFLDRNHATLGYFSENVLPVILNDKARFLVFIAPYIGSCREDDTKMSVFLAALKVGRLGNILSEDGKQISWSDLPTNCGVLMAILEILDILNVAIPDSALQGKQENRYQPFRHLLMGASSELRILTYGLLTLSPAANTVVRRGALTSVSCSIKYLHDDADAHERGEILSITRRLLKRISSSLAAVLKSMPNKTMSGETAALLADYRGFSVTFYEFTKSELGAHVSYQRHILGLHSLRYLIDHVVDPEIYRNDVMLIRSLTSLVLDPFEDVRNTSASILQLLSIKMPRTVTEVIDGKLIASVSLLAVHTVRGDHAHGLGRLWALYNTFRTMASATANAQNSSADPSKLTNLLHPLRLSLSQTVMLGSSSRFPIHGSLLSLSFQLQDMKSQEALILSTDLSTVLEVCITIWATVRSILCVDSPETAYEVEDDDGKEGPKDLLAYSWRALRDSSLLMQSLLAVIKSDSALHSMIGDVCVDQLISLRHRGAFSTVAQTFSMCCDRARLSPEKGIRLLVEKWYKVALSQIDEQGDRLTRRSAGLPAMFSALLSPADSSFFSSAVQELIALAEARTDHNQEREQKLPQVHALNCLKEIMTHSKFAAIVVQFLNPILALSAASLSSPIWAIRNCGLMLLKACINRLDSRGSEDTSCSISERLDKDIGDTPSRIALNLLSTVEGHTKSGTEPRATSAETIFSALDLLGHSMPPNIKNYIIDNAIQHHLRHSNWAVRDHAALLLSKRLSVKKLSRAMRDLQGEAESNMSQNLAHGILLCFRYMLHDLQNHLNNKELDDALSELEKFRVTLENATIMCPYVEAAIFDLLNDAAALILENGWSSEELVTLFVKDVIPTGQLKSGHCSYLQRRLLLFQVYTLFLTSKSTSSSSEESMLIDVLVSNPESLSYLLEILIQKRFWPKAPHGVLFLVYLMRRIQEADCVPSDTVATVTRCLVDALDQLSTPALPALYSILGMVDLSKSTTRDGTNAAIRLEAYQRFAATTTLKNQKHSSTQFLGWVTMVEFASMDPLDFPTRWSAARALSTYFRLVGRQQPDTTQSVQGWLRPKVILYSLLNDDDDDVRAEAALAAAGLLQQDQRQYASGFATIAARELLLNNLVQEHGKTAEFAECAVMRILLLRQNMAERSGILSLTECFAIPVQSKIHRLLLAKEDLFAEESQNLYIDDIEEIHVWNGVLRGCVDELTPERVGLIAGWSLEGLRSILDILRDYMSTTKAEGGSGQGEKQTGQALQETGARGPTMHPLGPTYDADLLVVFVQVISLAGTVRSRSSDIAREQILEQLKEAQQLCRDGQVSEVFVTVLSEALAGT